MVYALFEGGVLYGLGVVVSNLWWQNLCIIKCIIIDWVCGFFFHSWYSIFPWSMHCLKVVCCMALVWWFLTSGGMILSISMTHSSQDINFQ